MKRQKVISWKYMPPRLPFGFTALWYLVLQHFDAPSYLWGAFWLFIGVVWVVALIQLFTSDHCKPLLTAEKDDA